MRVDRKEVKKEESIKKTSKKKIGLIHILHILDGSGSMGGWGNHPSKFDAAIEGMQEEIEAIKNEKDGMKYTYSVIEFDSPDRIHTAMMKAPVDKKLKAQDIELFKPSGNTALMDAIGQTLSTFTCGEGETVVVKIFTDGGENASRKWGGSQVKELISQKEAEGWVVTFVGTEADVNQMVRVLNISVDNALKYDGTAEGLKMSYSASTVSRQEYAKDLMMGSADNRNFFKK